VTSRPAEPAFEATLTSLAAWCSPGPCVGHCPSGTEPRRPDRERLWANLRRPGGVPERPNGAVSKTVRGASPSRVQIPPPPLHRGEWCGIAAHAGSLHSTAGNRWKPLLRDNDCRALQAVASEAWPGQNHGRASLSVQRRSERRLDNSELVVFSPDAYVRLLLPQTPSTNPVERKEKCRFSPGGGPLPQRPAPPPSTQAAQAPLS
jgi:hypothetical protein